MAKRGAVAETPQISGLVPMDQQLTEDEIAAGVESVEGDVSPDAPVVNEVDEGPLIDVDPNQPWGAWPVPDQYQGDIKLVKARENQGAILLESYDESGTMMEELGTIDGEGLRQLSNYAGFPVDFVQKLPAGLRAEVVSDRLAHAGYNGFTFLIQDGTVTNMMPDWRQVLPYSYSAQRVYDQLINEVGPVTVTEAKIAEGVMRCRFTTELEHSITPKVGDVLRFGIGLNHNYGTTQEVYAYIDRLICENGMTSQVEQFKWSHRTMGTPEHQLAWLVTAVDGAKGAYDQIVTRARVMAETEFEGDAHEVLLERARAMNIPRRFHTAIVNAFDVEPGETEWHLLNAITRAATHSDNLTDRQRRTLMTVSGEFTREFDMVNATLPGYIASRIGARIFDGTEGSND